MSDAIELDEKLRFAIGDYWDIAQAESSDQLDTDDEAGSAQAKWSEIDCLIRQLAEQRAELLEALNRAFDLIASIGYPANTSGRYDKTGKWTFDESVPDHTNASAVESAFDVIADAIANATQQRNATGGEG